jgi:hypothetical protein
MSTSRLFGFSCFKLDRLICPLRRSGHASRPEFDRVVHLPLLFYGGAKRLRQVAVGGVQALRENDGYPEGRRWTHTEERLSIGDVKGRAFERPDVGGVRLVEEDGEVAEDCPGLTDFGDGDAVLYHLDQAVSRDVQPASSLAGGQDAIALVVGRDGQGRKIIEHHGSFEDRRHQGVLPGCADIAGTPLSGAAGSTQTAP